MKIGNKIWILFATASSFEKVWYKINFCWWCRPFYKRENFDKVMNIILWTLVPYGDCAVQQRSVQWQCQPTNGRVEPKWVFAVIHLKGVTLRPIWASVKEPFRYMALYCCRCTWTLRKEAERSTEIERKSATLAKAVTFWSSLNVCPSVSLHSFWLCRLSFGVFHWCFRWSEALSKKVWHLARVATTESAHWLITTTGTLFTDIEGLLLWF